VQVKLNIFCNIANELLSLSQLLYRSYKDLFAFLTVIWQHLKKLDLQTQLYCSSTAKLCDLDHSVILSYTCCVYHLISFFEFASLVFLSLERIAPRKYLQLIAC